LHALESGAAGARGARRESRKTASSRARKTRSEAATREHRRTPFPIARLALA